MLVNKEEVMQIVQVALDAVSALADQSSGDQQAQIDALKVELDQKKSELDAANLLVADLQSKVQVDESKIEKAKEDLA